jgi:hypothetical protein
MRKSSIILNSNSEKRNSIFMKGNAYFLNAHLSNIFKCCVRSCRQLVKTLKLNYSIQQTQNEFVVLHFKLRLID